MNYNQLFSFYTFVKEGGVVKAAKKLAISQPALSMQLKLFEESLGETIFLRSGRKITITNQGQIVLAFAERLFPHTDRFLSELRRSSPIDQTLLRVGLAYCMEKSFFVDLLCYALGKEPSKLSTLKITSGHPEELDKLFADGELDIIFTNIPLSNNHSERSTRIDLPVYLFLSCKLIHGSLSHLSEETRGNPHTLLNELQKASIGFALLSVNMKLRKETDIFFLSHNFLPKIVLESDLVGPIVSAVINGFGATFMPLPHVFNEKKPSDRLLVLGPRSGFWSHTIWIHSRNRKQIEQITRGLETKIVAGSTSI